MTAMTAPQVSYMGNKNRKELNQSRESEMYQVTSSVMYSSRCQIQRTAGLKFNITTGFRALL